VGGAFSTAFQPSRLAAGLLVALLIWLPGLGWDALTGRTLDPTGYTGEPFDDAQQAAVQANLPQLQTLWAQFKALLTGEPNRTGAAALYDANETLQSAAHYLTVSYSNSTGSLLEHLIGMAGRQRMLSQRLAKFYFYRTWELYEAPADMEIHLSRAHFTAVLAQLEASRHVTPAIQAAATRVRRAWEPYQQALFASNTPIATQLGLLAWQGLMGQGSLQGYCHLEGLNTGAAGQPRVRIGILGNNEANCDSVDSWIGIGASGGPCNTQLTPSAGNVACYNPDWGSGTKAAVGYVLVR